MPGGFFGLNGTGDLNGATKEQQFFSQGGFSCVWVTDNAEGSAFFNFLF